ncbi:UNVERIFIED_CONTAM: hypothetical protein GTU68_028295 [Idotea baltica]|nr:hypothetical protein [Idotea baltica]
MKFLITYLLTTLLILNVFTLNTYADPASNVEEIEKYQKLEESGEKKLAILKSTKAAPSNEEIANSLNTLKQNSLERTFAINNFFVLMSAILVIFMQAGFAMLEAGFNAAKNVVNILCKNLLDMCVGILLFYFIGYKLMYPGETTNSIISFSGFFSSGTESTQDLAKLHPYTDLLFQIAFAATAATIVSGAVAGRLKFAGYLTYSAILTGLIYPISGFWKWGGGWLESIGFHDFAGSIVVHALGGFAGLAGAIILGPRIGRFVSNNGVSSKMPGHSLAMAALGAFILFVGWFGFNPGSQLAIVGFENTSQVMSIALNTALSAAAGSIVALGIGWYRKSKPEVALGLNGMLAGLVGITACCDCVTTSSSIIIGGISGILVFLGIALLEKAKIDDPVGAWPVHGLCGIWGGIATGIFGPHSLMAQIIGSMAISIWALCTMSIVFIVLRKINMLRVSEEEELLGLDITEHGEEAYQGFFGNQYIESNYNDDETFLDKRDNYSGYRM